MKWIWITLGLGAGFVLGSRAGREQFERIVRWSKGASDQIGMSTAAEQIAESARSAGETLHEAATARSHSVLSDLADAVSGRLDAAASSAESAV
jgi:hypothetical protein